MAVLIKRAVGIAKGSGEPNKNKVGKITLKQVEEIAKLKMPDLNCDEPGGGHAARCWAPPAAWASRSSVAVSTGRQHHGRERQATTALACAPGGSVGGTRSAELSASWRRRRGEWMARVGKKYAKAREAVAVKPQYPLPEAVATVAKNAFAKFDETVEVAMRLGVDPKHADQMVRGTVILPHGLGGKAKRVLVIASGEKLKEAQDAGADFVGGEDMVTKIQTESWLDFDAVVATPDMMKSVGKLGKVLGPRGLMPNPKTGTVTFDVGKAVREIKAGKVEYRVDKTAHRPRAGRQGLLRRRQAARERAGR